MAVQLAAVFYIIALLTDLDIMDNLFGFLTRYEEYELNELLIAGFIISIGLIADLIKRKAEREYKLKLHLERLHVLRSTMRTMQDIINNLVVALQYFRINSEDCKELDEESLELIDSLIKTTTDKINILSNLEDAHEKEIYSGLTVIDIDEKKTAAEE